MVVDGVHLRFIIFQTLEHPAQRSEDCWRVGSIRDQSIHVVWTPPPLNGRSPFNFVDARMILVQLYCYESSVSGIAVGGCFNIAILFLNSHQGRGHSWVLYFVIVHVDQRCPDDRLTS
jgi:hypothetical protein